MSEYNVLPSYGAISCVRDLCLPWINIWSGDEWGESMASLHDACKTDYGFSDEDCAVFATKLLSNLIAQKDWMDEEGHSYGLSLPEDEAAARQKCKKLRDYWLEGGNLKDASTIKIVKDTLEHIPDWFFDP